uniref:Uncharacterized protein n=1 Tax=Meleagris gallopavo TaxID=9103 RepID=G1MSJ7_MELGA
VPEPHKCNYCGQSYKRHSLLEELKERCHSCMKNVETAAIKKLTSNLGKCKSSTPQKFVGKLKITDTASNDGPSHPNAVAYLGADSLHPVMQHAPSAIAEVAPVSSSPYAQVYHPNRIEGPINGETTDTAWILLALRAATKITRSQTCRSGLSSGEHILFLDYVIYTIHTGCQGYWDPLECNICSYQSQDWQHTFHWAFSSKGDCYEVLYLYTGAS